jgi:hypothetical protein
MDTCAVAWMLQEDREVARQVLEALPAGLMRSIGARDVRLVVDGVQFRVLPYRHHGARSIRVRERLGIYTVAGYLEPTGLVDVRHHLPLEDLPEAVLAMARLLARGC